MKWNECKYILVIDDDETTRNFIVSVLEGAGYKVTTCKNGKEGVSAFSKSKFDLVVTDISMPVIDGIDTIILMRKSNPAVPIIAMSGAERAESFLKVADHFTADATLPKPFDGKTLLSVIKKELHSAG